VIIEIVEQGGENPPRSIQLIIPHKIRMIPLERIEYKCLVRLGDMQIRETAFVRQIQLPTSESVIVGGVSDLGGGSTHGETGQFGIHFHVHRLIRLNPNHKFITRDILENPRRNIIKLDSNLRFLLVQC
jgi:hypothetical protein